MSKRTYAAAAAIAMVAVSGVVIGIVGIGGNDTGTGKPATTSSSAPVSTSSLACTTPDPENPVVTDRVCPVPGEQWEPDNTTEPQDRNGEGWFTPAPSLSPLPDGHEGDGDGYEEGNNEGASPPCQIVRPGMQQPEETTPPAC